MNSLINRLRERSLSICNILNLLMGPHWIKTVFVPCQGWIINWLVFNCDASVKVTCGFIRSETMKEKCSNLTEKKRNIFLGTVLSRTFLSRSKESFKITSDYLKRILLTGFRFLVWFEWLIFNNLDKPREWFNLHWRRTIIISGNPRRARFYKTTLHE